MGTEDLKAKLERLSKGTTKSGIPKVGVLTPRMRRYVEIYFMSLSHHKAAQALGLGHTMARRYRRHPQIKELIRQRLAETQMTLDEVLSRLSAQARAEYADYFTDGGGVDLHRLLADGKGHLIKGFKRDRDGNPLVEFYDAQAALILVGKNLGGFKESTQVDVGDALARVLERLASGDRQEDDKCE